MGRVEGAGDAEVGHLHRAGRVHQNVAGLHITVHHVGCMCEAECASNIERNVGGTLGQDDAIGAENVGQ